MDGVFGRSGIHHLQPLQNPKATTEAAIRADRQLNCGVLELRRACQFHHAETAKPLRTRRHVFGNEARQACIGLAFGADAIGVGEVALAQQFVDQQADIAAALSI